MFDHRSKGIFKILDDTMKIQCHSSKIFLGNIFSNWGNHARISKPKITELNHDEFIIRHFSGDVLYNVVGSIFYCFRISRMYLLPILNFIPSM